jgi:hypothetical protein
MHSLADGLERRGSTSLNPQSRIQCGVSGAELHSMTKTLNLVINVWERLGW